MTRIKTLFGIVCAMLSLALFSLNIYGEVKTLNVLDKIPEDRFLFENDVTISADDALELIKKRDDESDLEFAKRLTGVVEQSLGHLHNWETTPPDLYSQRVPASENLWLHLAGRISKEKQLVRYHFADYRKTLERGIALCGDHSNMLSQILWENNIPNSILLYERHGSHVLVEVRPENEPPHLLDADFGAVVDNTATDPDVRQSMVYEEFKKAGHDHRRSMLLSEVLMDDSPVQVYDSVWDTMKKRYILEKVTYAVKWLAPTFLMLLAFIALRHKLPRSRRSVTTA